MWKNVGGNLHDNFAIHVAIHADYYHAVMQITKTPYLHPRVKNYEKHESRKQNWLT